MQRGGDYLLPRVWLLLKGEPCATFSCDRATGEFYRNVYPGVVTRGYHCHPVQQPYFNTIRLTGEVPNDEILRMIDQCLFGRRAKLPKYALAKFLRTQEDTQ